MTTNVSAMTSRANSGEISPKSKTSLFLFLGLLEVQAANSSN